MLFGLACLGSVGPALACAPPPSPIALPGETTEAAARREAFERQREMWNGAESVYLARVSGITEIGGDTSTEFDLITAIKGGTAVASLTSQRNGSCATHAYPVGTFVILYAYNNRSGAGRVGHVLPVSENADPRIPPLLRAAAARLRNSGQR